MPTGNSKDGIDAGIPKDLDDQTRGGRRFAQQSAYGHESPSMVVGAMVSRHAKDAPPLWILAAPSGRVKVAFSAHGRERPHSELSRCSARPADGAMKEELNLLEGCRACNRHQFAGIGDQVLAASKSCLAPQSGLEPPGRETRRCRQVEVVTAQGTPLAEAIRSIVVRRTDKESCDQWSGSSREPVDPIQFPPAKVADVAFQVPFHRLSHSIDD